MSCHGQKAALSARIPDMSTVQIASGRQTATPPSLHPRSAGHGRIARRAGGAIQKMSSQPGTRTGAACAAAGCNPGSVCSAVSELANSHITVSSDF